MFALMWATSRRDTAMSGALILFSMVSPSVLLLIQRRIVNVVADHLSGVGADVWTYAFIALIASYAVVSTLDDAADSAQAVFADRLRDQMATKADERILRKIAEFATLDLHEDPSRLDAFRLAAHGTMGVRGLAWSIFGVGARAIGLIPMIVIVGAIAWWIPVVMLLSLAPGVYAVAQIPIREWRVRTSLAGEERHRDLIRGVASQPQFARELRLFHASDLMIEAWVDSALPIVHRLNDVRVRLLRQTILLGLVFGLGIGVPIAWVAARVAQGQLTVGDLVVTITAVMSFRGTLWVLISNGGQMLNDAMSVGKYQAFIDMEPPVMMHDEEVRPIERLSRELTIDRVTFTYPGASTPTLRDFSLALRHGEAVALVGANGAGKTTISRLLGRLFDPQRGEIRWDHIVIRDREPADLRHRLAVVPQDFAQFPLTLRENVATGRLNDPPTDDEIVDVLRSVGLEDLLERTACPLDTKLTKELEDGTQLSGGQWQRLAIARALIRAEQADVVILDEPTAALDPTTELEIARLMLRATIGKTALIISHRLGICTLVGRVVVLADGQIVEDGSHRELLARDGAYAEMFRSQAEWYR